MPDPRSVHALTAEVRYTVGVKAEIDKVPCDEWHDEGDWVVFLESDAEVMRYNRAHVVRLTVSKRVAY